MRWVRFAALVLVASILQIGPVGLLGIQGVRPDLLLILLVFFAVRSNPRDAILASFAIGFVADLVSTTMGLMGPRIISFGLFGSLLADVSSVISPRRAMHQAVIILLMGGLTAGLSYLLTLLRTGAVATSLTTELLWQPLYSALLGPFLFLPIGWWMRLYGRGQRRPARKRRLRR
jgi:rod shape-determining protein MreD